MKFLAMTLIPFAPDPITGIQVSTTERLKSVVENAVLAEELGFDGYGVGERHERPFLSSSPPVAQTPSEYSRFNCLDERRLPHVRF